MIYAFRSDRGMRKKNEDSFHIPDEGRIPLVIVADGMGGHIAGEVASSTAVKRIVDHIERAEKGQNMIALLRQSINVANRAVYDMAMSDDSYTGMGTTVVMALLEPDRYVVANIGDSRLYHFDGARLRRVTRDHSYVQELVSAGMITEEQAKDHPQRNLVTRAVGTARYEKADVGIKGWKRGDVLLLCSDGLCGTLDDSEMERILRSSKDLLECCDRLTERALDNGSSDNITVVLARNAEAGKHD
ncbi:MAG: Stp1/IreP family PP2C-type Ser/Thr phosphatase [Clostridiales bacterium]|nr:Stp1/IreP family PP2C-type Ser/Thr phosphatase [Clostridiales bacterium]